MHKFLGLCIYFHLWPAVVAVVLVASLLNFLLALGALPMVPGGYGTMIVVPVFLSLLFGWSQLKALLGWHGPSMFLDKVCIHQTDAELKWQGILKLAAFLANYQSS